MVSGSAARKRRMAEKAAAAVQPSADGASAKRAKAPEIIAAAQQSLEFARQGLADYLHGGERRVSGLFNVATSGRTVTFVLQNMRGHVAGFDEWYSHVERQLRDSPVARWAKELRNRVEKRGDPGPRRNTTYIQHLDTGQLMRNAPPGTISTSIGDQWGRNFWMVQLADGTTDKVYFSLPGHVGVNSIVFEDGPDGRDAGDLLREYVAVLAEIVADAAARFG